ncbi:thrombospondin-type laminin G domain and EAR repeat-containing protein-like isoform X2 [Hypomesus transpacificus]|uniref:thrombospondin-type laminin G domain and EAR repeat-containing protein-like isoform X2 n=1 Tax=Hypomesus transpacificus TaxID=137520 RepID=UPI001F07509F|nr:thrombospondin-type laminin G domain and EAR repeat-containing protein-like isoform X2 [Hypomesus transpacificus]
MSFFTLLLLYLVPRTITMHHGTRTPCTDQLPLDLLSRVLPVGAPAPPSGLRMIQAGGVRGVRFSHPHPSLSFPSSQLLMNCDLFPREFSIVVTLKITRIAPKRNEYIFSVVEEKDEENKNGKGDKGERSDEEQNRWRKVEDKDKGRTQEKDGTTEEDQKRDRRRERVGHRGRLLLGLRLSRDRFHFLFQGHGGVMERWVFRGVRLADNRWHTLVLAATGRYARLTVDCNTPLELVHSRSFPSDMRTQGSKFHIGSQGRRKGIFSGLIRQLVLVPGWDATPDVCPSSNPRLAELAVPAVLLDLPFKQTEISLALPRYEAEVHVSVGLERKCSVSVRGQLWFNPQGKGLYLCDGTVWVSMLKESERLDYVEEHQILPTSSETYDIEVFHVAGVGLMAAMAHSSSGLGSAVYLWTHDGFQLYQNISTYGALAWRHFTMGKKVFLVVSNSAGGPGEEDKKSPEQEEGVEMSVIYRWSDRKRRFVRFQSLQTHCARDWEAFHINKHTYLTVANHRQGDNNHTIDSVVYRWNPGTKSFQVHQMLRTSGAYDWEFFSVGPYHFLVVANAFDGVTTHVDSVIYVWLNGSFRVFQTIKTFCATDWEMFQIGSRVFLIVANGHRLHGNGPSRYAINSTIYELDVNAQLFIRFQDIVTYSAVDWEFFTLGEESFLVVANSFDGQSYSLNSVLYRWQGYEGFVPVHRLPTIGCSDWEFFNFEGESYLIYSSAKAPLSKVFKLKTH